MSRKRRSRSKQVRRMRPDESDDETREITDILYEDTTSTSSSSSRSSSSSSSSSCRCRSSSSSVDMDLTDGAPMRTKDGHTVWVVNVGFKQCTGEHLVDNIMNFIKLVKFLPPMVNCFYQYIALREIHEHNHNQRFHGRVRCVIKLAHDILGPEWHTVEQGWQPDKNWNAYKIIEVRKLFVHVINHVRVNLGEYSKKSLRHRNYWALSIWVS